MAHWFRHSCLGFVLATLALLTAGCGGSQVPKAASASPTVSPNRAFINVVQTDVQQLRPGSAPRSIQPGDSVDLQPKDQIRVEGKGRAFLEFPQQLEVELVRRSQMAIDDLRIEPAGSLVVRLKQIEGHSLTRLEARQKVQLTLATDYATIAALTDDTQILVCHVPGALTCVVAVNGQARVEAKDQAVILKTGESTFVTPNQPPHAPFCADLDQIRDWWYKMRSTEDTDSLGSMMVAWLQKPCATALPGTAVSPGASSSPAVVAAASTAGGVPSPTVTTPMPDLSPSPAAKKSAATTPASSPTVIAATPAAPPASPTAPPPDTRPPSATVAAAASPTEAPSPTAAAARLPSNAGMVKIGPGNYVVGGASPDDYHAATRQILLPGFWIDKLPVTNAQYKVFVDSTGRSVPAGGRAGTLPAGSVDHPVAGLTWNDAAAFCAWVNKRLPGEAEWEVAGRGPTAEPPLYPWGNDPTAGGQTSNLPQRDTYEVGTVAFNRSPFDVYDMIGAVWQWVDRPYAPVLEGLKILRGGRYGLLEDLAYRQPAKADDERYTRVAGMRCAADRVVGE